MKKYSKNLIGVVGAAAALALTLTGCSDDGGDAPDKSAVAAAVEKELNKEAGFKELPEDKRKAYADCTADVMIKYADSGDVKKFADGDMKADDVEAKDKDDKAMEKDATACAKKIS